MKITIAVCTYNRFAWLKRCLEALKKQTLKPEKFDIIVVDNSLLKTDSTAFRDSLLGFRNLEYIITDKSGLSYARNIAIDRCQTPIIAFIDDDAIAAPDWAEKIIKAFNRYPAAGVIGGRVNPIWEEEPPVWLKGKLLGCLAVLDWGNEDIYIDAGKWLVGANVAYRTDILRKCGGFNLFLGRKGSILLAHEELSTNISIQLYGYDVLYVPSIEVRHLIQKERLSKEWLLKDAMWEGASRVIYEHDIENTNLIEMSNRFERLLVDLQNEHDIPDQTERIIEARYIFNTSGRNECKNLIRFSNKRKSDFYFSNIISVIYIVTPCLNAANTIDQTILSVLTQAGDFSIRYHVQDGGSTDGTLEKLTLWKERLESDVFPIQCKNIVFTFASNADHGMYDALAKGFETMSIPPNAFMTWINADDILMPGAFAFIHYIANQFKPEYVSWLSGSASIIKEDINILQTCRPTPTDAVKHGLCDGIHWHFLMQEGIFFRNWLWNKVGAGKLIKNFKYAGDWDLWRLFAHYAYLIQFQFPLAASRLKEGQLSQRHFDIYKKEIESTVTAQERSDALRTLVDEQELKQRILKFKDYPSGKLILVETGAQGQGHYQYHKHFGNWPKKRFNNEDDKKEHTILEASSVLKPSKESQKKRNNIEFKETPSTNCLRGQQKIIEIENMKVDPDNFNDFTFARRSHWDLFKSLDIELFGKKIDCESAELKNYQDLLVFAFIKVNVPAGSNILEVDGGHSRILKHFSKTHECWNIDALEGLGNGPKDTKNIHGRLIRDYMGNFNPELPDNYFDFVFSISALEHVPQGDTSFFDKIIDDINRVLKPGGYSFHLLDVIFNSNSFWTNKIIYRIFERVKTCNAFVNPEKISNDPDLYCMSETAYNKTWFHNTKKTYSTHGCPSNLSVLWKKNMEDVVGSLSLKNKNSVSFIDNQQQFAFFIVTPSLNTFETIDQTIQSVISQAGNLSIRYHVQDGGSTDGTIDKLKHWEEVLTSQTPDIKCQCVNFTWSSEPDQGVYDAIIKGFDCMFISPDNFMTWINADDVLMPSALYSLCKISLDHPEVQWIGGPQYVIKNDAPILERDVPTPTAIIREGLCDGHYWHFLQQEGMFFKKRLWFKSRHALRGFKLAGDWSLWRELARHAEYFQCKKPLGAFRRRKGQLSITRLDEYKREMDTALAPDSRAEAFTRLHQTRDLRRNLIKLGNPFDKPLFEKDQTAVQKEFEKRWKKVNKG